MTPSEFRYRFIAHILADEDLASDPELLQRLTEFVSFDRSLLLQHGVPQTAADFLCESGLPRDAAPFLGFEAYPAAEIAELYDLYDMPRTLYPIGSNGFGDPLGIELSSGAVVYFNHDCDMQRVFINTSVEHFALSLCWYQELRNQRKLDQLLAIVRQFDPPGAAEGTMWHAEAASTS